MLLRALAFGALCSAAACKAKPPPPITWQTDEPAARAQAKAQHKGVVVWADASWDKAGVDLEREVWTDPAVRAEMVNFVPIFVEGTVGESPKGDALLSKYGIVGTPAIVIIDTAGAETKRIYSFVPPAEMLSALKTARR
jgi:thioredoxin:protein disulfide reductase